MKDLEHASINGVEIHNLAELDDDENLLYSGQLWSGDSQIGSFHEDMDAGIILEVLPEFEEMLNEKINSYLSVIADEDSDEELPPETFVEDLIELEVYLQKFKEGVAEGYGCLLVNYGEEGVDVYSIESEDDVEEIARDNGLTEFQTFYEFDHFIIDC